ncbi:MAG: diguanylate cyclase [Campylobacterota bacterium]|nr:diguanylate cyclase [Campylobacterota bacterium]
MSAITLVIVYLFQENTIHKHKAVIPEHFQTTLHQQVKNEAAEISEYIKFIQCRENILQHFRTSDKKELYSSVEETYKRLNKNVDLTHMYFIKTDGTILLRVHDYNRDGDFVDRTTFLKARESQSLFYGLEFGIKKNYTLRVVKPWIVDGELIGYVELGKEIDKLISKTAKLLETQIYMAVKKEVFADSPEYVKERLREKSATSEHYIVYNTFTVPQEMESIIDGTILHSDIALQEKEYFISRALLSDVSGKELGYFVFLSDITLEHTIMYNAIKILSIVLLLVATILLTSGYIVIQRKERSINTLTSELNTQKENLANFNSRLQKLFDLQKNMVILTNTTELHMANQAVYDFFGFKDLSDFLKHHKCICERFVPNDNFFHLGKVAEGKSWVETIKSMAQIKHVVAMQDKDLESRAFRITVNEFDKREYIISFTDISDTVIERNKLERQVTHDKLTGALNREFFDREIDLIIKEADPQMLGVVLCDIDHFKHVNDTYGHNRGDIVLKQLVQIVQGAMRREDYLIRWGGEEFIILMKVDTIESLQKATDHIRTIIEKEHFEEIDNITCSFGATLHLNGEEQIIETIERADQGLYRAKKSGRNQVQVM